MKKFRLGVCVAAMLAIIGVFTSGVSLAQEHGPIPRPAPVAQQR